jgi:hypothetical protein
MASRMALRNEQRIAEKGIRMSTLKLDLAAIREIYPSVRSDGDAAVVNTLCDEVERLRKALEQISKTDTDTISTVPWRFQYIAKKALES